MGEVYLAEHLELGRKEALKILMPSLATDPTFVSRFRREARAVNRLHHPNIITIYDFGQLPDERFYLSMEYADGPSVKALLRRGGRFTIPRALHILGQLAYAVHHAHPRGVLHRDLKADNLIATGDDETLKVLDFGVAKIVAADQPESGVISNTNIIWGSPRYMAPERIGGVGDDPRSDLYAIGCLAYELVVGAPPFNGEADEIIHGHLSEQPEPPSMVRPEIAPELETTILRLLAKDPADRFQSAAEAFAALRKVPGYPGPKLAPRRRFVPVERAPAELDTPDRTGRTGPNRGTLRELADALLDLGLSDTRLVSGIARLRDHEQSLAAFEAMQDALEHELTAVRQTTQDREASLRFALGELELAAAQPGAPGRRRRSHHRAARAARPGDRPDRPRASARGQPRRRRGAARQRPGQPQAGLRAARACRRRPATRLRRAPRDRQPGRAASGRPAPPLALTQEPLGMPHVVRAAGDAALGESSSDVSAVRGKPIRQERSKWVRPLLMVPFTGRMICQVVDGHEIVRPLGVGGMGEVYLARDATGGLRALKIVRTDRAASSQASARFRREVLALCRLQHPGIVQIVDAGQLTNGALYLAMEYVAGPDLAKAIETEGSYAVADALLILARLASALSYAHDVGIVHRDLKPANVILADSDPAKTKIIDFGLAKIIEAEGLTLTDEAQVLGSPGYWAPEQSTRADVGPPADVYAFGALAYVVLSGAPLFCARPAVAMIYAHAHEAPEPIEDRVVVPRELADIVAACVSKVPQHRPRTDELAAALGRLSAAHPVAPVVRRAPRPARPKNAYGEAIANQIRHVLVDLAVAVGEPVDDIERLQNQLSELELELAMQPGDATLAAGVAQLQRAIGGAFEALHDALHVRRVGATADARALFDELDALVERSHSR